MTEQTDKIIYAKFKRLFSWQSAKELIIYLFLVGLLVIVWGKAEETYSDHNIYLSCLQEMKVCGDKGFSISCNTINFRNYSSFSGNSSFNVSSS
jgi:hypothetical protein